MGRTEINGIKVIYEFETYHHEWECDGYGWITQDGKVWLTSHGGLYEADISEVVDKVIELKRAIINMKKAIRLHKERSQNDRDIP